MFVARKLSMQLLQQLGDHSTKVGSIQAGHAVSIPLQPLYDAICSVRTNNKQNVLSILGDVNCVLESVSKHFRTVRPQ